jgi:hypothetical protein
MRYGWLVTLLFLTACGTQPVISPVELTTPFAVSPIPADTEIYKPVTPSPYPTEPIVAIITPEGVQVEHWEEYEDALGVVLLPPDSLRGEVLCEWSILERSDQKMYVWAFCQSPPYSATLPPSAASVPAVIELDGNGMVQSVKIPGNGSAYTEDIRRLFPASIQDTIFGHSIDTTQLEAHINYRREHPEPPLIVLSAMPSATPIQ